MTNQGVEVKLPGASTASAQTQPDGVIVTLLPDGAMRVNQEIVASGDYAGLESKLRVLFVRAKSRLVILEGDRKAFLGNAIEVMDHARKAGAESFAVATAPAKD
jgi:biopolymer transport protein ExbD